MTDEQDSAVVYFATREKLPVVELRRFMARVTKGVPAIRIARLLDNILNDPVATVNVRTDFRNWQAGAERKTTMDVKIVYLDDKNVTVRTSDHKTRKHSVEELEAILSAYTELKGKIGDGCEGIERLDGKQWLLFADPSNEESKDGTE